MTSQIVEEQTDFVEEQIQKALKTLDNFILAGDRLKKSREIFIRHFSSTLMERVSKESRAQGALEAYTMFLEEIKNGKKRYSNTNEFEITCNAKDLEKSIKYCCTKLRELKI